MKLLIVSTATIIYKEKQAFAYAPYVNELVILKKNAFEIDFCCPVWEQENGLLITQIPFEIAHHFKLIDSNLKTLKNAIKSFFNVFYNLVILFKAMRKADHIHLRCPGNIGLLGSFVQIFFPHKTKTAKYAGNWDPKSKQPWSYRLQKYILSNTFLTRKMQVLVYGEWKNQSKNVKSFFTATYSDAEKIQIQKQELNEKIKFIFTGSLVSGKNPMYALLLVNELLKKDFKVQFDLFGEGPERAALESFITENKLEQSVFLHGNQNKDVLKIAYQKSHFVILPSKSEGWPKTIAEGMFWGCVPVATAVSCVPYMLDYGNRGILLEMNLEKDLQAIEQMLLNEKYFLSKSKLASEWSKDYTTDIFEAEIKRLLVK
ncbi:glycosyltransferase [Flavobacterium foetidum]|uniref:glycosyltransferase n=1 Tax=Flavobacterium foetidum TaxID=2026681 RepID=UPI0010756998|nr:glycosyltransferase [Flavobacterium foetidum]KAF2513573.1 glycosyltransferase [Flavobacterium foetidum]